MCEAYRELAREETRLKPVYFCGRVAEYPYVNTDEAIERALERVNVLRMECSTLDPNLGAS